MNQQQVSGDQYGGFLSHRGTPSHHPNFHGIVHEINEAAIKGYSHDYGKPHVGMSEIFFQGPSGSENRLRPFRALVQTFRVPIALLFRVFMEWGYPKMDGSKGKMQ